MRVRRLGRLLRSGLLVAALLAFATPARSEVELRGEAGSIDAATLDSLLRLELGDARVVRVTVDVKGRRADVEVEVGPERRTGAIDLPERDVERTIALFAAELARTVETPQPPPETPTPAPAPAPAERPPEEPTRESRLAVLAAAGARMLANDGSLMFAARAELGWRYDLYRFGLSGTFATTSIGDTLGNVGVGMLNGGIAASRFVKLGERTSLALGPRFQVGSLVVKGDGSNAKSVSAFHATAAFEIELHVRLVGIAMSSGRVYPLSFLLALDGGLLFPGIEARADERTVIDVSGPFATASAGFAW